MGCNCKKPTNVQAELKPQPTPTPEPIRTPDELHVIEMNKYAQELSNQIQEENIQETNQQSN